MRSAFNWPELRLRNTVGAFLLLTAVAVLIWFSFRLAAMRIFHVDECSNIFGAYAMANGKTPDMLGKVDLFQVILSWLVRGAGRSIDVFTSGRFGMLEIFWLNILLLTVATGEKLLSARGMLALFIAATLSPLWDYGTEIRHDNMVLAGILLLWCGVRASQPKSQLYLITGAVSVILFFVAGESIIYLLPLSLGLLVFPPRGINAPRRKLALLWLAGAVPAFVLVRLILGAQGLWSLYLDGFARSGSGEDPRLNPWFALAHLFERSPMVMALMASGFVALTLKLRNQGWKELGWDSLLPEAAMLLIALAALLLNPGPCPSSLLIVVPFAFLFAWRHAVSLWSQLKARTELGLLIFSIFIFAHIIPFAIATNRHQYWSNSRQERLMHFTEQLTDPEKDPVFDRIGMIPTRHHLGQSSRETLMDNPAPVLITTYRTDRLPGEDQKFIRDHYVSLSDDFWVLGQLLPSRGGAFEIVHSGRYYIGPLRGSNVAGTYKDDLQEFMHPTSDAPLQGTLDGKPIPEKPILLAAGTHTLTIASEIQPAVVWAGPKLDRPPRLGFGDHKTLFVNLY